MDSNTKGTEMSEQITYRESIDEAREVVVVREGNEWAFGLRINGAWGSNGGYMPSETLAVAEAQRIARGIRFDASR